AAPVEVHGEAVLALLGRGPTRIRVLAPTTPHSLMTGVLDGPVRGFQHSRTFGGAATPVAVLVHRAVVDRVTARENERPAVGREPGRAAGWDGHERRRRAGQILREPAGRVGRAAMHRAVLGR